jgi:putative ABC transport system ATP-binding protein
VSDLAFRSFVELPSAAIRIAGLRRDRHGRNHAQAVLESVDLTVGKGEWIAVAGPSGSGKTTLLNVIAGLDRDWSGSVEVIGVDLGQASDRRLARLRSEQLGFVFQDYALLEAASCLENVALPGWLLDPSPRPETGRRAAELLKLVGLEGRADERVANLSGGERQRVAIARALVNRPSVLLCDEPTGNLDDATGGRIVELLDSVHRQSGLTVVVATHDRAMEDVADRVLSLREGRLVAGSAA